MWVKVSRVHAVMMDFMILPDRLREMHCILVCVDVASDFTVAIYACPGSRPNAQLARKCLEIGWLLWAKKRQSIPSPDPSCHRVRFIGRIAGLEDHPPAPILWHTSNQIERAQQIIPVETQVLAIAPAANWRGKQWRTENFSNLMKKLIAADGLLPGALVAVIAAENEHDQADPLLDAIPAEKRIDLVGTVDLGTLGACLGRCDFFVGNDSGLMHMAAATGIPTLGLFGPSQETLYAPWGTRTHWVRTPESFETLTGSTDYDHRTTDTLMDGLTVNMVLDAACLFWQEMEKDTA